MPEPISFDLSIVERKDRFSFWHDIGSLVHRPIYDEYQHPTSLMVRARMLDLSDVVIGRMKSSAQHFERTESMIKKDQVDSLMLILLEKGEMSWSDSNGHYSMEPGDLVLLDNNCSFRCEWTAHQQLYCVFPRDLLSATGWHEPTTALLKADDPRANILRQHLRSIWQEYRDGEKKWIPEIAKGLSSLTALYFSDQSSSVLAKQASSDKTHRDSIRLWIESNLHRSELDASEIASSFYLSRSRVYELFKPWGGVRSYLKVRRLQKAHQVLESSTESISISKLAFSLGFRSLSSFSRAFHEYWGIPPKEAAIMNRKTSMKLRQQLNDPSHYHSSDPSKVNALKLSTDRYYNALNRLKRSHGPVPPSLTEEHGFAE